MSEGEGIVPEIVVSALPSVTDQLLRIARFACTSDHVSWQQKLEALKRNHMEAADKLFLPRIILAVLRQELAAFRQRPTVTALASEVSAPVYSSYESLHSKV